MNKAKVAKTALILYGAGMLGNSSVKAFNRVVPFLNLRQNKKNKKVNMDIRSNTNVTNKLLQDLVDNSTAQSRVGLEVVQKLIQEPLR